jgi:multidrug efflux pump subunit AcrA (membrane-fusion protein)
MTFNRSTKTIVVLAALVTGACSPDQKSSPPAESIAAPVVAVKREILPRLRPYAGTIRASQIAPLSARIAGEIAAVHVAEGDRVTRGQLLLEIDAREIDQRRSQADSAQAGMASAVESASAAVAAAEAQAQLAETTWRRYSALRQRNSVSVQEYEEVEARHRSASADLERARRTRSQLDAQLRAASAAASEAETFAGYTRIRAPFDGVVSARSVDPGALAAPGMPMLVIDSGSQYRVEATVDEAAQVSVGQEVIIDTGGRTVTGRVTHSVPALDAATRTSLIKVALPPGAWRSGAYARLLVPAGAGETLTVPPAAIVRRGGLTSVFVVAADGTARLRLVTVGQMRGQRIEILTGLSEGERIVAAPAAALRDGVRVNGART